MNFKRGRPKNARSGCLMCKPWKANKAKNPDTLDVRTADQPEACLRGSRGRKKPPKPQTLKLSCSRCGRLIKKVLCTTRKDFQLLSLERSRMTRCEDCKRTRRQG